MAEKDLREEKIAKQELYITIDIGEQRAYLDIVTIKTYHVLSIRTSLDV